MKTTKKGTPPKERTVRLKCPSCGWEGTAKLKEAKRTALDIKEQRVEHVFVCPPGDGCGCDISHWG